MPKSREVYIISGNTFPEIRTQLNGFLSRLADRIDKIEGLRGEFETEGAVFGGGISIDSAAVVVNDENGKLIHSLE